MPFLVFAETIVSRAAPFRFVGLSAKPFVMKRRGILAVLVVCSIYAAACSTEETAPSDDSTADSGAKQDSSTAGDDDTSDDDDDVAVDSGGHNHTEDASTTEDSSVVDSSTDEDSGVAVDSGVVTDSGACANQTLTVTNSGASAYIINGATNPSLTLCKGFTYTFNISASGHPFWIKSVQGAGTSNGFAGGGLSANGKDTGSIVFTVPAGAPATLFYNCEFHGGMTGTITIK